MSDAIIISDSHLRAALAARVLGLKHAGPLMAALALDMHGGVEDVLDAQGTPKWRGLSTKTTIPARRARGTWPGKMLQVTGQLASSIQPDSSDSVAQVSTNLAKAKTLHFGAKQGQFGRSKRNGPLPWGNIPARPFMVITQKTKGVMLARTIKWARGDGV